MESLRTVIIVGAGGFVGTVGRYLATGWAQQASPFSTFPVGTMTVNLLGCFLIGLIGAGIEQRQLFGHDARLFLLIGVLGGFTTFSSFAFETLSMAREAAFLRAVINIAAQVILGLASAWLGFVMVRA